MITKNPLHKANTTFAVLGSAGFLLFLTFIIIAAVSVGLTRQDLFSELPVEHSIVYLKNGVTETHEGVTSPAKLPMEVKTVPGGTVTLTVDVEANGLSGRAILFNNNRHGVTVYADSKELYSVNTSKMARHLRFYNSQIIQIPEDVSSLTLVFSGAMDGTYKLPEISGGTCAGLSYCIMQKELPTMALLFLLMAVSLLVLFLIVFFAIRKRKDPRLYSLFTFLLLAITWGYSDSDLSVITSVSQEVIGILCYMSLLGMSIPLSCYIWRTLHNSPTIFLVFAIISAANMVSMSLLSLIGISRLEHTFYSAFVLLILVMILAMIYFKKEIGKHQPALESVLMFVGTVIASLAGFCSIAMYIAGHPVVYRNLFLAGLLIYLLILLTVVMTSFFRVAQARQNELTEMHMLERFSFYDSLTGLLNRRAFEKRLTELEKTLKDTDDAILVMLDVNGLKMTNDTFGHAAGDDLIVAAARQIEQAFGDAGSCYRIGGDEFTVIITDMTQSVTACEAAMEELIRRSNETSMWKLSIAHGYSHLLHNGEKRISFSDWKQEADLRMYINKKNNPNSTVRNREKDFRSIIDCIISTVEARDVYTASHSDRVRELSFCIADAMGVSPSTREHLALAAHLHDIGKIGIPDRVLFKPNRLTDEELQIMKQHPVIGAEVVSKAPNMFEVSQTILHHHERYDGTGYPDGIAGDQIPLTARIIAVADSIDAMTSRRCYREPFSIDHCRSEIERCAGTMYDPVIAKITLEHWEEIEAIILLHPKRLIDKENEQAENALPAKEE